MLTVADKPSKCHCEERFLRRGNLEFIEFFKTEIASPRSQRRLKDVFSDLLMTKFKVPDCLVIEIWSLVIICNL
jgi:hypothetical protein